MKNEELKMKCGGVNMIIRNKGGEFVMRDSSALLDFLRGELGNEESGMRSETI